MSRKASRWRVVEEKEGKREAAEKEEAVGDCGALANPPTRR